MNTGPTDTAAAHYLEPDRLQVGVFVMIELPWFKHPFAMNNFKIRSEDQLREVRALRLGRYRVDPARSDVPLNPESDSAMELVPSTPLQTPKNEEDDPAALARKERMQTIALHREHVDQVEKAFVKATSVMKNLNRNLFARPKETLSEIGVLIDNMVEAFLSSPESTLHVMGDKAGGEEVYFHSLNVVIMSLMLAKDLGFSAKSARELGVGAMLHDIGLFATKRRITKDGA